MAKTMNFSFAKKSLKVFSESLRQLDNAFLEPISPDVFYLLGMRENIFCQILSKPFLPVFQILIHVQFPFIMEKTYKLFFQTKDFYALIQDQKIFPKLKPSQKLECFSLGIKKPNHFVASEILPVFYASFFGIVFYF